MSIPLVQNNEKDSINTSIIAIKRNIERINMLLGLVDSGSPDLSGLATKQELEDAVTDLQPVNEVAVDNMHSVTSNAVAEALSKQHYYHTTFFPSTAVNGWNIQTINFNKTYKYPPLVTVTIKDAIINPVSPDYWRDTLSPFFTVETTSVTIAYYVRDSHPFAYDVNVIGEVTD